jgi:hypothetical protein
LPPSLRAFLGFGFVLVALGVSACGDDDNKKPDSIDAGAGGAASGGKSGAGNTGGRNTGGAIGAGGGPASTGGAAPASGGSSNSGGTAPTSGGAPNTGGASTGTLDAGADGSEGDSGTPDASVEPTDGGADAPDARLTCCVPITTFPQDACGTWDDGCGAPTQPVCDEGKKCHLNPETGKGVCETCVPKADPCTGVCGQGDDGCNFVECPDTCGEGHLCGSDNKCCTPSDEATICAGRCGYVLDACLSDVFDCGACATGECDNYTNTCCTPAADTCTTGVCGKVLNNCHEQVDCGKCSGEDVCANHLCRPSKCGKAECGFIDGESCGLCSPGNHCISGRCVPECAP